ncbi:MAG: alpha/beta fold hydrolase [Candidatus Obscuribacterales bacterium]
MREGRKTNFWSLAPAALVLFALSPFVLAQSEESSTGGFSQRSCSLGAGSGGLWGVHSRWRSTQKEGADEQGKHRGLSNIAFLKPRSIEERWSGKGKPQLKEMEVNGINRRYYFYKPESAILPAPLVLAFHGGGGTAEGTDKCTGGLAKLADEKGFIVVYPDALDKHWNDGRPDLSKTNYDDVGFISKIIDELNAQKLINSGRVYATGISNGGFFSQYLAIQLPNKIAAVATVAASVPKSFLDLEVSPVPIMMLLGTKDTLVPWEGGKVGGKILRTGRGEVIPGRRAVEFWLTKNNNTAKPKCTELPDKDPKDNSRVSVEQYGTAGSANEVLLYEIRGGGHTWPDGQQYLPKSIIGPVCHDFDGNAAIWNFFERHTLKDCWTNRRDVSKLRG